jgi:hypothetical protein
MQARLSKKEKEAEIIAQLRRIRTFKPIEVQEVEDHGCDLLRNKSISCSPEPRRSRSNKRVQFDDREGSIQ